MKIRKLMSLMLVFAMVLALALSGCSTAPEKEEDVIQLGTLLGTSGAGVEIGIAMERGFMLAVEEVNNAGGIQGRKVNAQNYDIEDYDTRMAIDGYTFLTQEAGCVAVMGPPVSDIGLAMIDYAANYEVPLVGLWINVACTHDENDAPYPYMYLAQPTNNNMAEIMAAYMIERGQNKVALLYNSQTAYHTSQVDAFRAYCESHNVEIVCEQPYTSQTMDFASILTMIRDSGAECIYAPQDATMGPAILSTLDSLGMMDEGMVIYGDVNYSAPWTNLLPDKTLADNIYFPLNVDSSDEKLISLAETYLSRWDDCENQEQINVKYYLGYDIAQTIFQAIDICITEGLDVTGPNINACLEKVSYDGVTGRIAFSETSHQSTHDECMLYVYQLENGEYNCKGSFVYSQLQ